MSSQSTRGVELKTNKIVEEQLSHPTLSRFIGSVISVGLGTVSAMVLNLLGTVVAARHLPAEAFGAFVLLRVIASFLMLSSSFGLGVSVSRFVAGIQDEQDKRKLINTVFYFRIFTILIVSVIALVARSALLRLFGLSLPPELIIFVPFLFLVESLMGLLKTTLQGLFLFKIMALFDFISSLLNFLLTVVFLLILGQGIFGLVYARLISIILACTFAFLVSPIEWRLEFHFDILKKLLVFGFPLHINDVLTFIFLRIDTLMIAALLGPAEIAYYEIARKIPDNLLGLYDAFRSVFFPFISKLFALGEHKKAAQMLNHSMRLLSFASILAALVALVFGNEIIGLLFSAKYLPSVPVFVLLMIGLNFSLVNYTLGFSIVAVGDSDKPAIVNVVHMTVSLLGNLILIPILGILGAALAALAGFFMKHPLNVLFLRRRSVEVKVGEYLKPILIFGAYGLLFLLLGSSLLLLKVAIVILFILTCVLLSVITAEDLAAVSGEAKTTFFKAIRRLFPRSTAV